MYGHNIRVAFIGAKTDPAARHDFWLMACNYANIFRVADGFKAEPFETFGASKHYLAEPRGLIQVVFFTGEKSVADAVVAARQHDAMVFVFSEAYQRGAAEVLPDDKAPEATPGKPLLFALDSVSVTNMYRLLYRD